MSSVINGIPFVIRKARSEEAKKLSQLAFQSKAHWDYSLGFMLACRSELTFTSEHLTHPKYVFYLAECQDALIGFYGLEQNSVHEMELAALFVAPFFIGQGYGRVLLEHAQSQAVAKGASILIIQSDPNAQGFYRAMGAYPIGYRESDSLPGRYLPLLVMDLPRSP